QDSSHCVFVYQTDTTKLTKTLSLTGKPYEIAVTLDVQNLADTPKKHRLSMEQTWWVPKATMEGRDEDEQAPWWKQALSHLRFGRQSEHMTETVASGSKTERQSPNDFTPKDFEKKEFTAEKWRRTPGDAQFVGVSSVYFTKLLLPESGPSQPSAETRI